MKKKILIAEDDDLVFRFLEIISKSLKLTVVHAENGAKAVDIFQNSSDIDIILMDIKMPIMGGIEATKLIRKINKEIPIIAQTAYASTSDRTKMVDVGFTDYITKPIYVKILQKTLKKY